MQAAFDASRKVIGEINAKNADFKTIFDSQMAEAREGFTWQQVAENTFNNFMMRQANAGKL